MDAFQNHRKREQPYIDWMLSLLKAIDSGLAYIWHLAGAR